jgi:hypothetical protein
MAIGIIVPAYMMMHIMVTMMRTIACTVRANWVVVVMPVTVIPIEMWCYTMVWMPASWPIIPIVRRMPANPSCTPEPIVDNRSMDIYRLDDIVGAIDILISNHLYCDRLSSRVFLYEDRSYVLINILREYRLYNYEMLITIGYFYHSQIIHCAVAIEIQVGQSRIWVIEFSLELFQIFSLTKDSSYSFEIKVL